MARRYAPCIKCGGQVREVLKEYPYRLKDALIMVFERVPVGVCRTCCEEFVLGEVAEKIEAVALKRVKPKKVELVPHVDFK